MTSDGKGYGLGNTGSQGITRFLRSHTCNDACRRLGLPPVGSGGGQLASGSRDKGQGTVLAERIAREERDMVCRGDAELARRIQRGLR